MAKIKGTQAGDLLFGDSPDDIIPTVVLSDIVLEDDDIRGHGGDDQLFGDTVQDIRMSFPPKTGPLHLPGKGTGDGSETVF